MNKQEENINTIESREKQDHYQKYRGHSLRILEELENSGGMTTRQISDAILGNARVVAVTIQRLVNRCVLEKVENWGYKITVTGLKILSIFNKTTTTTTNNVNTTTTQQQHDVNMKNVNETEKPLEIIPSCFKEAYCHIRRILHQEEYTTKNSERCPNCTSFMTNPFKKQVIADINPKISI